MARALARASARPIEPSPSRFPRVNARPALVVVSAWNPRRVRIRAVPASHGLGMTNAPGRSWRALDRTAFSAWVARMDAVDDSRRPGRDAGSRLQGQEATKAMHLGVELAAEC